MELAPGSPRCGCAIETDGSEIGRQTKKKSRKEDLKIKRKKERKMKRNDIDDDRQNEEGKG